MKEPRKEKLLRLWKIRQEAEGYDVSNVHTIEEAEHYYKNPIKKESVLEGETTTVTAPEGTDLIDFNKMNQQELIEYAATLGLTLSHFKKKAENIAIIEAALLEKDNSNDDSTNTGNDDSNKEGEQPENQGDVIPTVEDIEIPTELPTNENGEVLAPDVNEGQVNGQPENQGE